MTRFNLLDFNETLKSIAGHWPAYTLLGSFILYVLGYLSLRFHLTVLGVGTDLTVLDEKYLFIGIKFFVFFVAAIPISLVIAFIIYTPIKLLVYVKNKFTGNADNHEIFSEKVIIWVGIILSLLIIQLVMRQPFSISNLLVSTTLPKPDWLILMLSQESALFFFYFPLLILGVFFVFLILWRVKSSNELPIAKYVLLVLFFIQALLIPVNYGSLILDKKLPRVTPPSLYDNHKNIHAWLVWEGKTGITYLIRDPKKNNKRTLATFKKGDISFFEILCYDTIIPVVFDKKDSCI